MLTETIEEVVSVFCKMWVAQKWVMVDLIWDTLKFSAASYKDLLNVQQNCFNIKINQESTLLLTLKAHYNKVHHSLPPKSHTDGGKLLL